MSTQNSEKAACLKPFQFKKGQSGNPGGRPKTKPFWDAIQKHLEEHPEDAAAIIRDHFKRAKKGSIAHARELMDRTDGPVKQVTEHTGEGGGPVEHTIRFGDGKKSGDG